MPEKKPILVPVIILTLVLAVFVLGMQKMPQKPPQQNSSNTPVAEKSTGSGDTGSRASYDIFGSTSASGTLSTIYASSTKTIFTNYADNLHLDIQYRPTTGTNQYMYILVEGSNDGGTTFFPISSKVVGTTEIDMYVEDTDGNGGLPIIIPGDKTSASGTIYSGMVDLDVVAEYVRISAKETTQNTNTSSGRAYIRATSGTK